MAFGASVQPLTKMTPKVKSTVSHNAGVLLSIEKNSDSVIKNLTFLFLPNYNARTAAGIFPSPLIVQHIIYVPQ